MHTIIRNKNMHAHELGNHNDNFCQHGVYHAHNSDIQVSLK